MRPGFGKTFQLSFCLDDFNMSFQLSGVADQMVQPYFMINRILRKSYFTFWGAPSIDE